MVARIKTIFIITKTVWSLAMILDKVDAKIPWHRTHARKVA